MKKILIILLLIPFIFTVGCSKDTSNTEETVSPEETAVVESSADTITIKDMKGDVEIPKNPQRVVDVSGSADELIILGVPFVGSANTSMFDGVTVPTYLKDYFDANNVEVAGNYSGVMDLNLEKIAELKPDLIIMNIRHEKVYDQLKAIAPTAMLDDDITFVNWRGRFEQLGDWFGKADIVKEWLANYDKKAVDLSEKIKSVVGDETFAVIESNSVHMGSFYVYRTGGAGSIVYDEFKLNPSAGIPENVWGEVVDAEYFSKIDADHIFYFTDNGELGETANLPSWKNLKAVKNDNVYYGINDDQYNMAYTPNGKFIYMDKLANAIIDHTNVK